MYYASFSRLAAAAADSGRGGGGGADDGAVLYVSSLLLGERSPYFRDILDNRSLSDSSSQVLVSLPDPQGLFDYLSLSVESRLREVISFFTLLPVVHTCM